MTTAGHVSTILTSRKVLCVVYGAIAVAALILTWANAAPYIHSLTGFFVTIWQDAKVNEASQFVAAEMVMLAVSSVVLMVIEGRRYGVRFVWAYVAVGYIIAISVAFPVFLIARAEDRYLRGRTASRQNRHDSACGTRDLRCRSDRLDQLWVSGTVLQQYDATECTSA
jgi:hypothetical protein